MSPLLNLLIRGTQPIRLKPIQFQFLRPARAFFVALVAVPLVTSGCSGSNSSKAHRRRSVVEPFPAEKVKEPCPTEAIDQEEFRKKLQDFRALHGVEIQLSPTYEAAHEIVFTKIPDAEMRSAEYYLTVIDREIKRHALEFLEIADVSSFALVKDASVGGDPVVGLALFDERHLLFSVDSESCHDDSIADTMHHELFHMFHWVPDPPSFDVMKWASLNDPAFKYGATTEVDTTMNHPRSGFVDGYAQTDETEDSAETFSAMMLTVNAANLKGWVIEDRVLASKVSFIKSLMAGVNSTYSPDYWARIENGQ